MELFEAGESQSAGNIQKPEAVHDTLNKATKAKLVNLDAHTLHG